ncbi:hypothetical protein CYMTET_20807 [Cymbomonas tetramitiformis]|uniref:Uncharacterized protein n=1 Tax=Cymbomonas tetramitiformis TaxID=36881 RepID=A0AAE0G423_9CHLO|nr:hypothetical protein CYMTET_20807 [Cymbomonas tetramitiformis]
MIILPNHVRGFAHDKLGSKYALLGQKRTRERTQQIPSRSAKAQNAQYVRGSWNDEHRLPRRSHRRTRYLNICASASSSTSTASEALVTVPQEAPLEDWAGRALRTLAQGTKQLLTATAHTGAVTRRVVSEGSKDAIRSLVSGLLGEICGQSVVIEGPVRVLKDALTLGRVRVGEDLYVHHIVLKARLEPLLAALKSWGEIPEDEEAPPVFVNSIHVQGVTSKQTHVHGILQAYSIFRDCRGLVTIGHLKLVNLQADVAYHDAKTGQPEFDEETGEQKARTLELNRMEFTNINSRQSLAQLATTIHVYEEPQQTEEKILAMLPEVGAHEKNVKKVVHEFQDWIPPALQRTLTTASTSTGSLAFVENLAPVLEGDVAGLVGRGGAALFSQAASFGTSATEIVGVADAGIDVLRAAAGTELIVDTALVFALVAQGLPSWFFQNQGGKLLLKMVETGIAAALLKQGNLLKEMRFERELIEQGVLRDVLYTGVVEAMLDEDHVPMLTKLLEGEMLQVVVDTRLLQAVRVHA